MTPKQELGLYRSFRKVVHREDAVSYYENSKAAGHLEQLAALATIHVMGEIGFPLSAASLRRWAARYQKQGVAGLMERKKGRVGRKPKPPRTA